MSREPRSELPVRPLVVAAVALTVAVAGYLWWRDRPAPEPVAVVEPVGTPSLPAVPVPAAPDPSPTAAGAPAGTAPASPPPVAHPLADTGSDALPEATSPDAVVRDGLIELLGRSAVLSMLQVDDIVRRVVATVDNLGRSHAPVALWPVVPTPGRYSVQAGADGRERVAPGNAARYAPFVDWVSSIDSAQAAAFYRRVYPLFQQSYEGLGFPGRYFNDRLVAVMDLMIATPVPAELPVLTLVQVRGEVPSTRPWVRYEFADPALQGLSAGQKLLLRMGPEHQRRLQAKLRELRSHVARS